ncbi:hypothetical protein DFP72DRAFT_871262 [Ephemerocybe angulata]|uniref:DUF6533 domain-containing protein n=1 Tax=Ephemerocybe angulata TaxID=980116 RepID=A0A8H6IGY0_9AGAR|nr:hypothetical protein DFP72DRAFT_871262 [Tulosesus angulatus]
MAGAVSGEILEDATKAYAGARDTAYVAVAGYVLVVSDYLHTLPDEISLMWPVPFGIPKALFFFLRYWIIAHNIFNMIYNVPLGRSPEACKVAWFMSGISSPSLVVAAEAILCYRVYAFSGKSRGVLIYLLTQFTVIHVVATALLVMFLQSVKFRTFPDIPVSFPCIPHARSALMGAVFSCLLTSVVTTMCIMMYLGYVKHRRILDTGIIKVFYRDGVWYFVCLSALATTNIFITFFASEEYRFLFTQAEIDVHAILATRMLLHLRVWAAKSTLEGGRSSIEVIQMDHHRAVNISFDDEFPPAKRNPVSPTFPRELKQTSW